MFGDFQGIVAKASACQESAEGTEIGKVRATRSCGSDDGASDPVRPNSPPAESG